MRKSFIAAALVAGPAAWPAAAAGSHSAGGGPHDFAAGGGKASVQNFGELKFSVSAHTDEETTPGGAHGNVNVRGATVDLKLDVVCMTTVGDFSFIETEDRENPGLFYDVSVIDSGQPGGEGDHFAISGPWGDPICGGGVAQENSFVTSGNLVVHDAGTP